MKTPETFASEAERKAWARGKEMSPAELAEVQNLLKQNKPVPDEPSRIIARIAKLGGRDLSEWTPSQLQAITSSGCKVAD
jgi:hypothetical protein